MARPAGPQRFEAPRTLLVAGKSVRQVVVPLACAALACGGGGANATFSGTIHGQTFSPEDAISSTATVEYFGSAAWIVLTDANGLCASLTANQDFRSTKTLTLVLWSNVNQTPGPPAGIGTFSVYAGTGARPDNMVLAEFVAYDATCSFTPSTEPADATSGSVTLTRNSGGSYEGTFVLIFNGNDPVAGTSNDRVTGTFNTSNCPGLSTFLNVNQHECI